jgi:hypothetical protein
VSRKEGTKDEIFKYIWKDKNSKSIKTGLKDEE